MKKIFLLILLMIPGISLGQSTSSTGIITPQQRRVYTNSNSYDGYEFNIIMANQLPIIRVDFIQAKKNTDGKFKITTTPILSIRPSITIQEETQVADELKTTESIKPAYTKAVTKNTEDNENLIQIDSIDGNGVVRVSQWFDKGNFFRVKYAVYDGAGSLLYFQFYKHLDFDTVSDNEHFGKPVKIKLEDFLKNHAEFKFENISDVENICNDIYEEKIMN